jgi:superfamily II DNA or RNA helicase
MKIIVNNDKIIIQDITDELKGVIVTSLVYTDKSKQYQLKRLAKTAWGLRSDQYKKLQSEVKGHLYKIADDGSYEISSCFFDMLIDSSSDTSERYFESLFTGLESSIIDNRTETGKTIALPWVNKLPDLREYQEEAVEKMLVKSRGTINLATGLGKTLLTLHFIKRYKKRALIVCPGESVALQFYEQLVQAFGKNKVGFFGGGKKQIADITVGIAASICKSVDLFKKAELGVIVIDETHHTPANTFFDIAEGLAGTGKIFGLTATDYRSDGKDIMITAGCGPVICRRDVKWGIENKWLAKPYFIVREVETGARDFKDDKLKSYKAHVLNCDAMKNQIRSDAEKMISLGKSVLILVDEVAHGKELSEQLSIPFATGQDSKSQDYIDQLNASKIKGLVGTDGKISEGSDTRNVDVLIMANFVASKGPVIQAVGRALRKTPTKDKCLILDYIPVDSTMLNRHALNRVSFYKEITDQVSVRKLSS